MQNVADTIGEISSATQEQATGIGEVNLAVQQNAAFVEQADSSSENMANLAQEMRNQMMSFKLRNGHAKTATRALPSPPVATDKDTKTKPAPSKMAGPKATAPKVAKTQPAASRPAPMQAPKAAPSAALKQTAPPMAEDDFFGLSDIDGFEKF